MISNVTTEKMLEADSAVFTESQSSISEEAEVATEDNSKADGDTRQSRQKGRTLTRKQRARYACLVCRSRKVRCDVMVTGTPCTNCKLDAMEYECAVQRRKGRK